MRLCLQQKLWINQDIYEFQVFIRLLSNLVKEREIRTVLLFFLQGLGQTKSHTNTRLLGISRAPSVSSLQKYIQLVKLKQAQGSMFNSSSMDTNDISARQPYFTNEVESAVCCLNEDIENL